MRTISLAVIAGALVLTPAATSVAHEEHKTGDLTLVVGWLNEPALAGYPNAVQVHLDGPGADDAQLEVVVTFGADGVSGAPLPLDPASDDPHEYLATIIPTRPGTYTFSVTGTAGQTEIEETFTSGPDTFHDVVNPAEQEFPEEDPTRGELAEALARINTRLDELAAPTTTEGSSSDSIARWLAAGSLILSALAVILLVRRRSPAPRG